jgi:hypothetical protein
MRDTTAQTPGQKATVQDWTDNWPIHNRWPTCCYYSPMNLRKSIWAIPLACISACVTPLEIESQEHIQVTEMREFRVAQRVFREQNMGLHKFDFEGHGRVTVRDISLGGFPGRSFVKCRFHYQNRTMSPIVQSWVSLDVLDADGRMISTQKCHMIVPVPIPIARGSYVSDELRTPTYGAHLREGWTWRIRCVSDHEEEEEPLNPPVKRPSGVKRLSAPVIIKNRSQRNW